MVHFSGKARKMNNLSSFYASEASAKMPFNAYFEFMYGFKNYLVVLHINTVGFNIFVTLYHALSRRFRDVNRLCSRRGGEYGSFFGFAEK
ncbi:MAG: hypothetical protein U5L45_10005 [Saprospiraceae bacterium]|nr:hypothetical protein [Saprospiraceae bacterium]